MRERSGQILRITCLVLAALLLVQFAKIVWRINPLRSVTIPALPTLAASTNAPAGAPVSDPARKETPSKLAGPEIGAPGSLAPTNKSNHTVGTNSVAVRTSKGGETNFVAHDEMAKTGTNLLSSDSVKPGATNDVSLRNPIPSATAGVMEKVITAEGETGAATNQPAQAAFGSGAELGQTNPPAQTTLAQETEKTATNSLSTLAASAPAAPPLASAANPTNPLQPASGTNLSLAAPVRGTNLSLSLTNAGTNSTSLAKSKKKGTNSAAPAEMAMAGMNAGPSGMRGGRAPAPELPPEMRARVDRIYESEIFGQIMHPLPMALMGIAGNSAFLRSPGGQTGLVKEGDSLGEIKLLRVGINRVLVEQDGQKKELMIFEGYGGESLLSKEKETPK